MECLRDPPSSHLPSLPARGGDVRFVCEVCREEGIHVAFPNQKALLAHSRVKHHARTVLRSFVGEDCLCQCVKFSFLRACVLLRIYPRSASVESARVLAVM